MDRNTPPPLESFGEFRAARGNCGSDGPCVEVADGPAGWRAIRDSKLGDASPILTFTADEWAVFSDGVRTGYFD